MDEIASENYLLAEKLRNEDPEQFYTLVRMHLSFVLDLNTDDCDGNSEKKNKVIKWNLPFSKKPKLGTNKTCSEGPILTVDFIAQMKPVIEFLSKEENISQEGIFRRSGKVTRQQELKSLLHQGVILNFNDNQFSVHECATVLKNVLSELPESVLTDAHYPAYCQIAEFCNIKNPTSNERLLRTIQLLILLLPNENRMFFQEIIELLHLAFTHEDKNRMSADNLATLFTPHLLCPRKLSPEAFHTNSQVMSRVVAFMIQKGSELFEIPPTVATDVRAYWNKKEKRKQSPLKHMNESVCDGTAANTVFTFVDREKTAEENKTNPTETALAQLYAYIQSLPESSKKRKLIKQFNKENGYGTPLRTIAAKKRIKTLNLGDSIKKHLSGFSKTSKRNVNTGGGDGEDDEISSPDSGLYLKKEINGDEKLQKDAAGALKKPPIGKTTRKKKVLNFKCEETLSTPLKECTKDCPTYISYGRINSSLESNDSNQMSTKSKSKRSSSSPIEGSSPHKTSHFSEDKENQPKNLLPNPVDDHLSLVSSSSSSNNQVLKSDNNFDSGDVTSDITENVNDKSLDLPKQDNFNCIKQSESISVENPKNVRIIADEENSFDRSRAFIRKLNGSNQVRMTNNDGFLSPPNTTNRLLISHGSKSSFLMATSTPAATGNGCLLTPIGDKNNSMSPITKSTKRMPKAMQETMMTPRSRKPVISLSGTDLCSLVNTSGHEENGDYESYDGTTKTSLNVGKKLIMEDSQEGVNDSLSSPFRNYLFSRSVLTASPVDLSFSSRTDDFLSLSERTSSRENGDFKSVPDVLNEAELSESLLFCLDGNDPSSEGKTEARYQMADCSCSSFSDCDDMNRHVYETAL